MKVTPEALKCLPRFCAVLFMLCTFLPFSRDCAAREVGYQGTHILTYSTMSELARVFRKRTGIGVRIRGGGCADGIAAVVNSRYEMGGICCPLRPEYAREAGLVVHPIGYDIKVVIVNRANPLSNLSMSQLVDIHQGRIAEWKELGWADRPVAVIFRKHCPDMDEPVRSALGIRSDLSNLAERAIIVRTDKELIDYVSRFPTAIGITSRVFAAGKDVRILTVDGIEPSPENVRSGRYRLRGVLSIITKKRVDEETRKFLDFILSDEGQSIIDRNLAGIR